LSIGKLPKTVDNYRDILDNNSIALSIDRNVVMTSIIRNSKLLDYIISPHLRITSILTISGVCIIPYSINR